MCIYVYVYIYIYTYTQCGFMCLGVLRCVLVKL